MKIVPIKIIDTTSPDSTLNVRLLSIIDSLSKSFFDSVFKYAQVSEPIESKYQLIQEITSKTIHLVCQEKWETEQALEIGKIIFELDLLHPEKLAISQDAFLFNLAQEFPIEDLLIIFPRYCRLIVEIAAGFVACSENKILLEQEQIRSQIEKAKDEAENAKQQIEARHNVLVENIPEIIIIIDIEGHVIYYHSGKRQPYQATIDMEGINIKSFIPKELYDDFYRLSNKAISTGENQILTTSFPFHNKMRVFEGRIAPYEEDKTITIVRDITELVEYQNALKISQAHLQEMTRQIIATQESERHQIALDLHDQVLSQLGALFMFVDESTIPSQFIDNYHKLIDQIRATIYNLRPPMLNYGLYPALDDLHAYLNNHNPTNALFVFNVSPNDVRVDPNIELHLFRIIQEATNNACKHSQANRISISGDIKENSIWFTIEDDGIGLICYETADLTKSLVNNHFGLAGMFERAALIGADFSISSKPNEGTKIHIKWKSKP